MGDFSELSKPYRERVQYASVTERGFAWAVDIVLVFLTAAIGELIVRIFITVPPSILFLAVFIGYHVILEAKWGRTIGKLLLGIKVVTTGGESISTYSAVVRNVTKVVGAFSLVLILVGVILIADSRYDQRLGDRWGNTIVVYG